MMIMQSKFEPESQLVVHFHRSYYSSSLTQSDVTPPGHGSGPACRCPAGPASLAVIVTHWQGLPQYYWIVVLPVVLR